MKVQMKVQLSGSVDGLAYPAIGAELEVSDSHGVELCERGLAVPVVSAPVERAVAPDVEKRVKRTK